MHVLTHTHDAHAHAFDTYARASTTINPLPSSGLTPRTCRMPCGTLDACTLNAHVHAGRLDTHTHLTSMQDTLTPTHTQEAQHTPTSICILDALRCVDTRVHTLDSHARIHTLNIYSR